VRLKAGEIKHTGEAQLPKFIQTPHLRIFACITHLEMTGIVYV